MPVSGSCGSGFQPRAASAAGSWRCCRASSAARLASVAAGNVVGELALLSNCRRTADVIAVTPVSALVLTSADFASIARNHPRIHAKLIAAVGESLLERLRRANAVIFSLMR